MRADALIEQMIQRIVCESPEPRPQQAEAVLFSRRKSAQSNLANCSAGDLDTKGYPPALVTGSPW